MANLDCLISSIFSFEASTEIVCYRIRSINVLMMHSCNYNYAKRIFYWWVGECDMWVLRKNSLWKGIESDILLMSLSLSTYWHISWLLVHNYMKSIKMSSPKQKPICTISISNNNMEKSFSSNLAMESAQIKPQLLRKHTSLLLHSSANTHLPLQPLKQNLLTSNVAGIFPKFMSPLSFIWHSATAYKKMC